MLSKLKELISILSPLQKRKLILFQFSILSMSVLELILVSVLPFFIMVISNNQIVEEKPILQYFANALQLNTHQDFILALAFASFFIIVIGNLALMYLSYKLNHFAMMLGHEFSSNLFKYYLSKDYLYHTINNSPKLLANINKEVPRVYMGIFHPLMLLNSKLILSLVLIVNLFLSDPKLTLYICVCLGSVYILIYKVVKRTLHNNGKVISEENVSRLKFLTESFRGIKEVKFLSIENFFSDSFFKSSESLARAFSKNNLLTTSPRFILEAISFGGLTLIIIHLIRDGNSLEKMLPTLSLYALTGYKLMPAVNQIYSSLSSVKSNIPALLSVKDDLKVANNHPNLLPPHQSKKLSPTSSIQMENITFTYPTRKYPTIKNLNLTIPVGKKVAFVGHSGSGKTTTVDLLLGLVKPQEGKIIVDNKELNKNDMEAWKGCISYVAQSIFLVDSSVSNNVALGELDSQTNPDQIQRALKKASLYNFVDSLEEKEKTSIGENGSLLSGGQKQRIGLARAFYKDSNVIVLDEATSALDNKTEAEIVKELLLQSEDKTIIIIAHRLSSIKNCDQIYFFENGNVKSSGSFEDLYSKCSDFKELVDLSENR